MSKLTKDLSKEDRKMLRSIFWRSFPIMASSTDVKRAAYGFLFALLPAIRRFYKTAEERKEAMLRHIDYYNVTMYLSTFPLGLAASMERENATRDNFDPSSIQAVKAALMGPLSGIGDAFFWGTFRVIGAGVGISLAQQGSILGPILFLLIFHVPHIFIRYYGGILGYTLGSKFIADAYDSGLIKTFTKAASILGLIMVGAMVATMVKISTPIVIGFGEETVLLQGLLDDIFLGILPLGITLGTLYLLKKGVRPDYMMYGMIVLAFVLRLIGII